MAITNVGITGTLAASPTTIYSSSGSNAITSIIICNTSNAAINLTLYAVPSGKSPSANPETTIVSALPIAATETLSLDQEKLVLANGDVISGIASSAYSAGSGLVVTVSTLAV